MDARVVDRATSNNWGPQPVGPRHAEGVNGRSARGEDLVQMAAHCKVGDGNTKDPHRDNPDSALEDSLSRSLCRAYDCSFILTISNILSYLILVKYY